MPYSLKISPKQIDPPIDLSWLADWLGITIHYRSLPNAIAGVYVRINGAPHVIIECDDMPERQRWTLVHEMAHHMTGVFSDTETVLEVSYRDDLEHMCNHLAAEILMPEPMVRRIAKEVNHGVYDKTALLANMFEVSILAMRIRLRALGLTPKSSRNSKRRTCCEVDGHI